VWSKEEFQDMINIFDSNKDGHVSEATILFISVLFYHLKFTGFFFFQLDLTEFQSIFKRGGIVKQK
jgi:Ca2+-binding EF-hand superfamily protein